MSELNNHAPLDENSILLPPMLLNQNSGLLDLKAYRAEELKYMEKDRAKIHEWEKVGGTRISPIYTS
jgi:hypothetical protein